MPTLYLHVGMHKTASTMIQRRLALNRWRLWRHGLLYPVRRSHHKKLVAALERSDPGAWDHWLRRARWHGRDLLISAEAFSTVLHERSGDGPDHGPVISRLSWLLEHLQRRGWHLHLVAYLRDPSSYLNSRYTQLLKRFAIRRSCQDYVRWSLKQRHGTHVCDPMLLFGEALACQRQGSLSAVWVPFLPHHCPFRQMVGALGLPDDDRWRDLPQGRQVLNPQPGSMGVAVALDLAARLQRRRKQKSLPSPTRKALERRLRRELEREAQAQGWGQIPFQGISPRLRRRIDRQLAGSCETFASRAWGQSWPAVFAAVPRAAASIEPEGPAVHVAAGSIWRRCLASCP